MRFRRNLAAGSSEWNHGRWTWYAHGLRETDDSGRPLSGALDAADRVIVALGTHAAHALLKTDAPISRLRGRIHEFRGGSKLIPTFHPAFLLRSPERKRDVWEDMKKVRALLAESS